MAGISAERHGRAGRRQAVDFFGFFSPAFFLLTKSLSPPNSNTVLVQ
jgi:hypothetical protein